jgi:hypothetical protein
MNDQDRRERLLAGMAGITCMEKGRLSVEYREVVRGGKTVRLGPYYKHQCWETGRNVSRRVPANEADALRQAVEGYHQFQSLAAEFVELTIGMTRERQKPDAKKKRP